AGSGFRRARWGGAGSRGVGPARLVLGGGLGELISNGVAVVPLGRAGLTRRHPEFAMLAPDDADGYRAVWPLLEGPWEQTVARARALPEELLHERVDGEWSFIETLRHMLMVHDAWLRRAVLHDGDPLAPRGLPHDEMPDLEGVPRDRDAHPSLDDVLRPREERLAIAGEFFAGLQDELLAGDTTVTGPGYPEAGTYAVTRCLNAVLD